MAFTPALLSSDLRPLAHTANGNTYASAHTFYQGRGEISTKVTLAQLAVERRKGIRLSKLEGDHLNVIIGFQHTPLRVETPHPLLHSAPHGAAGGGDGLAGKWAAPFALLE